jgi:DNA repair protein RadC
MNKIVSTYRLKVIREETPEYIKEGIHSSRQATELLCKLYDLHEQAEEYMYMLTLNTRHSITGVWEISHGSINENIVHPREIYKRALLVNASGIILAHNHPSGEVSPSIQDVKLTERLKDAGDLLGIELLDHIIIGDDPENHYSFAEHRKL